jgi:hypothetical protein
MQLKVASESIVKTVHIEYAIDILDGDLVRVSLMPGLPGEDSE